MRAADLFKDGAVVVQGLLLLIVIAGNDVVSEAENSVIILVKPADNTHKGTFSAPVRSDYHYFVALFDLKADIVKNFSLSVRL